MLSLSFLSEQVDFHSFPQATIALRVSNAVDLEVVSKQVKATIGTGHYRRRNERGWKDSNHGPENTYYLHTVC